MIVSPLVKPLRSFRPRGDLFLDPGLAFWAFRRAIFQFADRLAAEESGRVAVGELGWNFVNRFGVLGRSSVDGAFQSGAERAHSTT